MENVNANAVAIQEDQALPVSVVDSDKMSCLSLMVNDEHMNRVMAMAKIMASSKVTVPKHLQGNEGDCMAIIIQAMNWGMNHFAVAQKTHLVNGTLGYEAQLVNAVIQASNSIVGTFKYEYKGDGTGLECRVGARLRGEDDITWGEWLKNGDVKTRNSPLWATNPRQQLGYLQVKNWARLYCPGAILGVYTSDEIEEKQINPRPRTGDAVAEAAKGKAVVIDAAEEEHRNQLCAALRLCAEEGTTPFLAKWKSIRSENKNDIYLVGEPEYNHLLEIAQAADAKVMQP